MTVNRDLALARHVWNALEREQSLREARIDRIDVQQGHVTLYGTVDTEAQAELAIQRVRAVRGVRSVESHLQVVERAPASDRELQQRVEAAIAAAGVHAHELGVQVVKGVVHLVGRAGTPAEIEAARQAALAVPGVVDVVSDAVVTEEPHIGDAELAEHIRVALQQAGVPLDHVTVTVQDRIAEVAGEVPTPAHVERARQALASLRGYTRLAIVLAASQMA
jgi:osmotically-inducible protein OsmY